MKALLEFYPIRLDWIEIWGLWSPWKTSEVSLLPLKAFAHISPPGVQHCWLEIGYTYQCRSTNIRKDMQCCHPTKHYPAMFNLQAKSGLIAHGVTQFIQLQDRKPASVFQMSDFTTETRTTESSDFMSGCIQFNFR